MSIRWFTVYFMPIVCNCHLVSILHIDKHNLLCAVIGYIAFNSNVHRLWCIGQINGNITSVLSLRDLVIAAFGDGRAFKRDRFDCGIFLRSYAIFRRTPPEQVHWPEGQMSSCMPQALHWWTASSVFSSSKPLLSVKFLRLMSCIFSIAPLFSAYNLHLHWNLPCNFF